MTESGFSYGEAIMLESAVASAARFDDAALLSKEYALTDRQARSHEQGGHLVPCVHHREAAAFQNQPASQMTASWLRSKVELERLIHLCEERSAGQSSDWLGGMHDAIESCMSDMVGVAGKMRV